MFCAFYFGWFILYILYHTCYFMEMNTIISAMREENCAISGQRGFCALK